MPAITAAEDENPTRQARTPIQRWTSDRTKARWVARVPSLVASCAALPRCLSRSKGIRAAGTDPALAAGTFSYRMQRISLRSTGLGDVIHYGTTCWRHERWGQAAQELGIKHLKTPILNPRLGIIPHTAPKTGAKTQWNGRVWEDLRQIQCLLCAKVICATLARDILGLRYSSRHNMPN